MFENFNYYLERNLQSRYTKYVNISSLSDVAVITFRTKRKLSNIVPDAEM